MALLGHSLLLHAQQQKPLLLMRVDQPFHIDADHINLGIVDGYSTSSDFFTIDVADSIGQPDPDQLNAFDRHPEFTGTVVIEGLDSPIQATREEMGKLQEST